MAVSLISCITCEKASCALLTLSPAEVKEMEEHTNNTTMDSGDLLLRQHTPFQSIIYLRSGYVKEFVINENSPDQIAQVIKPMSYIGLQSLFTDEVSAFSYKSITNIEVCYIQSKTFNSLIKMNGEFAMEILIAVSNETLSNQKRILGLNQKQIFGKVADIIIYLSHQVYESDQFDLHLSRSELSEMITSTRESVTRALLWFQQEGIIRMEKGRVEILDITRLEEISKKG